MENNRILTHSLNQSPSLFDAPETEAFISEKNYPVCTLENVLSSTTKILHIQYMFFANNYLISSLYSVFTTGVFPSLYKTASVTPLLKKANLDRNNLANFCPISNLHTISKILERLFLTRIIQHIELSPNFNHY